MMRKLMENHSAIIVIALLLSGCAEPLPHDRMNYVGNWQGPEMQLLIFADGAVEYQREKDGGSVSINAPLQEFVGDDFVVGALFMVTTFEVSEPPLETDGVWTMTVDGVPLTRVSEQ